MLLPNNEQIRQMSFRQYTFAIILITFVTKLVAIVTGETVYALMKRHVVPKLSKKTQPKSPNK